MNKKDLIFDFKQYFDSYTVITFEDLEKWIQELRYRKQAFDDMLKGK